MTLNPPDPLPLSLTPPLLQCLPRPRLAHSCLCPQLYGSPKQTLPYKAIYMANFLRCDTPSTTTPSTPQKLLYAVTGYISPPCYRIYLAASHISASTEPPEDQVACLCLLVHQIYPHQLKIAVRLPSCVVVSLPSRQGTWIVIEPVSLEPRWKASSLRLLINSSGNSPTQR